MQIKHWISVRQQYYECWHFHKITTITHLFKGRFKVRRFRRTSSRAVIRVCLCKGFHPFRSSQMAPMMWYMKSNLQKVNTIKNMEENHTSQGNYITRMWTSERTHTCCMIHGSSWRLLNMLWYTSARREYIQADAKMLVVMKDLMKNYFPE